MVAARTGDVSLDSNIGIEEAMVYPPLRSRKLPRDEKKLETEDLERARNYGKEHSEKNS